ncbi:MAG: hypothetical protein PHU62_00850 [Bacteroidales bacterium]|nr:hypothetical protein [Bacteroidales bacterium]MDD3913203.1 hypothetical protein [Bacteroidales bacterium]MDD4633118.1 hypothetical protein [Bacteroidales bacterium]
MLIFMLAVACDNKYTPKPTAYFRIALPEKSFVFTPDTLPFCCKLPVYASIRTLPDTMDNVLWLNVEIPQFQATIHLSYYKMNMPLYNYIETTRDFVYQHINMASAIERVPVQIADNSVYGIAYYIKGNETASPIQFFVTDSTKNFLRGALYFNHYPNNDSIAPVINFLETDIDTMLYTLKWK